MYYIIIGFLAFIFIICIPPAPASAYKNRNKRTLLYEPPGGVVQMITGVGLPLVLQDESLIIGMVIKASYHLPYNSSSFTNPVISYARSKRSISRWHLYETLAQAADFHGYGGKECILRTICEIADSPLDKTKTLLEELVHTIFTPSTTEELPMEHADGAYHVAERLGKHAIGSCDVIFPNCEVNFAQLFTKFHKF